MASLETPGKIRVPNAFMLFVKEKTPDLFNKCPEADKAKVGAYLGRIWRSMPVEDKRVYFDKYKALKKMEKNASDSNPVMMEKNMAPNKMKICSDEDNILKNKRTADKSFSAEETFSKFQNSMPNTDGFKKKKPLKKARRSPNAFLIFAREQRHTLIGLSSTNEKKCHRSTVLAGMWRQLPDSQKAKYTHEAKRLHDNLQKELKADSLRTNKMLFETVSEKPVSKSRKKKEFRSVISADLKNQEVNDIEKTEIESNSKKPSDVIENAGITDPSAGLNNACNSYPNSSYIQQHSSAVGNSHRLPPSIEPHHSNACCYQSVSPSYFNGSSSLNQNSASDACMSRSCFGPGPLQPAFPSYPYNVLPWMYPQPMAHPCFPLPPPLFYPSPYNYSLPYPYNSAYNDSASYINYYSAQYSRRIVESSTYAGSHSSTASATAVSSNTNEESVEAERRDESSDGEQLVIDEGYTNENQSQENGAT